MSKKIAIALATTFVAATAAQLYFNKKAVEAFCNINEAQADHELKNKTKL